MSAFSRLLFPDFPERIAYNLMLEQSSFAARSANGWILRRVATPNISQ
jgi:hypothetical protein